MTADFTGAGDKPTLNIQYALSNFSPTPQDDSFSTNAQVNVNVLSNDTDPDGDTLSLTNASSPSHGTAEIVGSQIRYTPTVGYSGTDSFTYTVSDGHSHTASATVNVTVLANPIF